MCVCVCCVIVRLSVDLGGCMGATLLHMRMLWLRTIDSIHPPIFATVCVCAPVCMSVSDVFFTFVAMGIV